MARKPRRPIAFGITGTPGTGKTQISEIIRRRGIAVLPLADLADDIGAIIGLDEKRASRIIDETLLADGWRTVTATWDPPPHHMRAIGCEGHYAQDVPNDVLVVLRTRPDSLAHRLRVRGWPESKVRENCEAEAFGIIALEALESEARVRVEVDTTLLREEGAAQAILAVLRGGAAPRPDPGRWDLATLPWL
ncbi:MAG: adenylate kinase family protein [Thermoplasmatota archaeon]